MALYQGKREREGCVVTVDGEPLDLRLDLRNHSPTGFEWGYGGSGPHQLALALLAHATDDETAQSFYHDFVTTCTSRMDGDEWALTDHVIKEWVKMQKEYVAHRDKVETEGKVTKLRPNVNYSGKA